MRSRSQRHRTWMEWKVRALGGLMQGRSWLLFFGLVVGGAVVWLVAALFRSSGEPTERDVDGEVRNAPGRPLLSLECGELGIGAGQTGGIALILDDANIIRPPGNTAAAGWPVFTFARVPGLVIGQRSEEPVFAAAGGVASRWAPRWEGRFGPVVRMQALSGCCLRVETAEGVTLEFVAGDLERQFRNLESIWRQSKEEGREIAAVNLMPERNVPVTWR